MKNFDMAILGSGASGCICALTASENGKSIALIDKNKIPAKKLMATGNGRCNLTNLNDLQSQQYFNRNIDNFLRLFNFANTIKFFENLGLMVFADEEYRVYPISNSAKSVVDVINNKINKSKNISILNDKTIEKIEKNDEKFKIYINDEIICADKVVFAMGGNQNHLIKNLGIKCKPNMPSLCALKTDKRLKNLAGIRVSNVLVTAISKKSGRKHIEKGEVMFREHGLSGIVIFNASTLFAREGEFKGKIILDLMPELNQEKLVLLLKNRRTLDVEVSKFFDGMFVNQLGYYLLENCKINENRSCLMLTDEEIENLARAIKSLEFDICDNLDNNQVFSGGVPLEELDNHLECKSCNGLYVCGEACDVDGICGGFNLQWAWTSGFMVGSCL